MDAQFMVTVSVEREAGPFASREDLIDEIREALEAADYGSWSGGGEGEYGTQEWDVEEHFEPKRPTRAQRDAALNLLRSGNAKHRAMADWIEKHVEPRPERRRVTT